MTTPHDYAAEGTAAHAAIQKAMDAAIELNPEGTKALLPSTPVAAYQLGSYPYAYTEDQALAMAAADRGDTVTFVKAYRIAGGRLVLNPWVDVAAEYKEPEAAPACEECPAAPYSADANILDPDLAPKAGTIWSSEDVARLRRMHSMMSQRGSQKDRMIAFMARKLGRTVVAITYKLHSLGLEPQR